MKTSWYVNTQNKNSCIKSYTNKHNMAIRMLKYGDQGVPDRNDDADFGYGAAAAAASHAEAGRGQWRRAAAPSMSRALQSKGLDSAWKRVLIRIGFKSTFWFGPPARHQVPPPVPSRQVVMILNHDSRLNSGLNTWTLIYEWSCIISMNFWMRTLSS